jgi:fido (protein-threonine AMPylation protein)
LQNIEEKWRFEPVSLERMFEIHRHLYGACGSNAALLRRTTVRLYAAQVTKLRPALIRLALAELDGLIESVDTKARNWNQEKQIDLAATIFCRIIEIHPFPDGNGRTARMFVNLIMRRIGRNYIVIPKVRNNDNWLQAMQLGLQRDTAQVAKLFSRWHARGAIKGDDRTPNE